MPGNMQVMWLRSALNEKETELLEVRDQHQRLLVSVASHTSGFLPITNLFEHKAA